MFFYIKFNQTLEGTEVVRRRGVGFGRKKNKRVAATFFEVFYFRDPFNLENWNIERVSFVPASEAQGVYRAWKSWK